ncbi:unnamed protein product [Ectocarpus sp. CCAP 1310/34]|nr:unnamed protein product [Ectocarpus sp. CCAP 1310/34]
MAPARILLRRGSLCCCSSAARRDVFSMRTHSTLELSEAKKQGEENRAWAKTPGARQVLDQPPFEGEDGDVGVARASTCTLESLEGYLQARRWPYRGEPARRFLSHILTYPLTLAAGLREAQTRKEPEHTNKLAVVCLGARAESTMPPAYWREALFALPDVSRLSLHLIGPELGLPPGVVAAARPGTAAWDGAGTISPISTAVVSVGARTADIAWTRAMVGPSAGGCVAGAEQQPEVAAGSAVGSGRGAATEAGAAEAVGAAEEAVQAADAFILFNPGLGHPHLRQGWDGALKRLLATGKPIVVSCHSPKDLDRDTRLLREAGAKPCCPPSAANASAGEGYGNRGNGLGAKENPFRSLMASEDPLSVPGDEDLVWCNWGMMVVRGAGDARRTGRVAL